MEEKRGRGRPKTGRMNDSTFGAQITLEERNKLTTYLKSKNIKSTDWLRGLIETIQLGGDIPLVISGQPMYLTREQIKDVYNQASRLLIGA